MGSSEYLFQRLQALDVALDGVRVLRVVDLGLGNNDTYRHLGTLDRFTHLLNGDLLKRSIFAQNAGWNSLAMHPVVDM